MVDEAHYIKNPEARRTVNVKAIGNHADRMLFMTGTALENKVDEMIALIQILQPRIASQIKSMAYLSAAPRFREMIAPVYYRRKREDVLTELPDLIESREWCTLYGEEESAYEQAVLAKHYADARRVSWNIDDLSGSCKAKRMLEIIEEVENDGRKVIVFSFFLDTIRKVCSLLGDKCLNPINGSVSPNRRQEIIDEFDAAPAGTVFEAQIQSGGTGLNIQSASVVILCEPQLKPSIENQAISRAYRMGQTRNVLVYRLLCENSIDEKITDMLEDKQRLFDAFADKSVAAEESVELDEKSLGNIIKEEIDRINAKNGKQEKSSDE
ncbi:MAG: DEAD/DEAH box helicase [Lachnospiraceae bacterium]|nr:DEAD/DEAH box helicase [Lachnospiraceae bacterium]